MALVMADRVKETSTTTGTGTITLAGAATGYQSFAAIGNGNTTYYTIAGQTTSEWEVGIGTYTSAGTTLSRDTVLSSSNSGSKVVFSAGSKDVFCTYPASKSTYEDSGAAVYGGNGTAGIYLNVKTINSSTTFATGFNGMSAGPVTIANGVVVTVPTGSRWVVV